MTTIQGWVLLFAVGVIIYVFIIPMFRKRCDGCGKKGKIRKVSESILEQHIGQEMRTQDHKFKDSQGKVVTSRQTMPVQVLRQRVRVDKQCGNCGHTHCDTEWRAFDEW